MASPFPSPFQERRARGPLRPVGGSTEGWHPALPRPHLLPVPLPTPAPALRSPLPDLQPQLPYFWAVFPFQGRLSLELFWERHEAAILALLVVREMALEHQSLLPGNGVQGSHPEPSASFSPLMHRVTHLKDRNGELLACLLELERSHVQCPLHMSPVHPFAPRQTTPLPTVPALPPAKKF